MSMAEQVGKDAVVIEADAIKNRDIMFKHLSSNDFTKDDPMLSSYVHEYSTKAAEMLLAAAGTHHLTHAPGSSAFALWSHSASARRCREQQVCAVWSHAVPAMSTSSPQRPQRCSWPP